MRRIAFGKYVPVWLLLCSYLEKYVKKPNDLQSVCGNMCAMISSAGVCILPNILDARIYNEHQM